MDCFYIQLLPRIQYAVARATPSAYSRAERLPRVTRGMPLILQAVADRKTIAFDRLRSAYVDLLADGVEFYDRVAVKELGRSPRHVLLLHEDDLAALYLGDLVARLRKTGWEIVSPDVGFRDPIASVEPDTLLLGQGRVIALAAAQAIKVRTDIGKMSRGCRRSSPDEASGSDRAQLSGPCDNPHL